MLPMLISLPGSGSNAPQAIEVEVLPSAPKAAVRPEADPATTSALPLLKEAPVPDPAPIEAAPSAPEIEAAPEPVRPAAPAPSVAHPNLVEVAPTEAPDRTVEPAKLEASPVEEAPDDMPQQVSPESNFAQFLIELQAGPGVGEDEIAGGVVELVAEHAMVIAELVEIWPKCGAIRSRA